MAQAAKAQEPSMEEILASIRRIIADDEPKPAATTTQPLPSPHPADQAADSPPLPPAADPVSSETDPLSATAEPQQPQVLDLTEDMTATPSPASGFRAINGQSDVVFTEPSATSSEPPAAPAAPTESDGLPPPPRDERLISGSVSAAVDSAFNSLAQTVLVHNARTLEDLVREMLRPMLRTWLDDNLPGLVERLVRAEIERVSRGRS